MPSPAEQVTEAHRLAQARLGARAAKDMLDAWRLLDPKRLDVTTPQWLAVATRLVAARRRESAELAAGYLRAVRLLETGEAFAPVVVALADPIAVATSLTVTGPVALKRGMQIHSLAQAVETASVTAARSGMRHALAGGRDTISATIAADPVAVGYQRVTSGKACEFCTMLAGRGAVYGKDTAHFAAHDGCSCSAQPFYETGAGDSRRVVDWQGRREDISDETRAGNNARAREFIAAQRSSAVG